MVSSQMKKANVLDVIVHVKTALEQLILVQNVKTIYTCKIHNAWQVVLVSSCITSQMMETTTVFRMAL